MATTRDQKDKIVKRLSIFGNIRTRAMMREYLVYYNEHYVGGIFDGLLLIKRTPTNASALSNAEYVVPYAGAKPMLHLPLDLPDTIIASVLHITFNELK